MRLVVAAALLAVATTVVTPARRGSAPVAQAETLGTLPGANFYPRVIRLGHAGAATGTVLASTNDGVVGRIWRSTDASRTFTLLSEIDPGPDAVSSCCIALFELPRALGAYPAGTLLWSTSVTTAVGPPRVMDLRVWRSDDHGATWSRTSSCATSTTGGLWEPNFHVADDGSLVCTFSDETDQPAHSQVLARTVSTDGGQTWRPRTTIVAGPFTFQRPGMATVAHLPDGTWVMTFELCGWIPACGIRILFSPDGLDWGPVDGLGDAVGTADGRYLAHTPVVTWSPVGGGDGALVLSGQILFDAANRPAAGNGATLFVNHLGGHGPWTSTPAPVAVADPTDNFCPNYSSPVIDVSGQGDLLELASTWEGPTCVTRWGTGRLELPPAPTTTAPTTTTPTVGPETAPAPAPAASAVSARPTFAG